MAPPEGPLKTTPNPQNEFKRIGRMELGNRQRLGVGGLRLRGLLIWIEQDRLPFKLSSKPADINSILVPIALMR